MATRKDVLQLLEDLNNDLRIDIIFAYRYLLNQEPESLLNVENNTFSWKVPAGAVSRF